MAFKLVIFDFDGTLADTWPWFARVVNDVADRYDFRRIANDEMAALRGLGAAEVMQRLGVPRWKLPMIANHMRRRKAREIGETKLFAGVDRMLSTLAEGGMKTAIVSSNAESNVRAVLGPANAARIGIFECGAAVFGKTARFRRVLRRTGVPAARTICIGDEIRDLEAARSAGIAFGAVHWGFTTPEALAARRPDQSFERMEEIPERLFAKGSETLAGVASAG